MSTSRRQKASGQSGSDRGFKSLRSNDGNVARTVKKDSFDEQPHSPQIGVEHDQLAGHSTLSSQSRPTQGFSRAVFPEMHPEQKEVVKKLPEAHSCTLMMESSRSVLTETCKEPTCFDDPTMHTTAVPLRCWEDTQFRHVDRPPVAIQFGSIQLFSECKPGQEEAKPAEVTSIKRDVSCQTPLITAASCQTCLDSCPKIADPNLCSLDYTGIMGGFGAAPVQTSYSATPAAWEAHQQFEEWLWVCHNNRARYPDPYVLFPRATYSFWPFPG